MNEAEIEQLIIDLRLMMTAAEFGWAAEQAEARLDPETPPRERAAALIDAAEAVTVDLAEAEIAALDRLGVEDIHFAPDDGGASDEDGVVNAQDQRYAGFEGADGPRGQQRRVMLQELAGRRSTFIDLRSALDGVQ